MTRDEFDVWISAHVAHFPGVGTWLAKFGQPEKQAILGVWLKHLATCELDDCLQATYALYGQGGRAPHYERHPQAIRAIVREKDAARSREDIKPRFVDGEQVFACLLWNDDGMVQCWHPKTVAAAVDGTLGEPFTVYTCAVACSCSAGDRLARTTPRYSPERWALVSDPCGNLSQTQDECWELIERLRAKRPAPPAEKQGVMF